MAEKRFPVQPVGVAYLCDECGKGLAVATGQTTKDGMIRHTCAECGFNYFFPKRYPVIEWRFPAVNPQAQEAKDEKAEIPTDPAQHESAESSKAELREVSSHGSSPITGDPIKCGVSSNRG